MNKAWLILTPILILFNIGVAVAQTPSPIEEKVVVSPARVEKELRPGDKVRFNLKVTNDKLLEKKFFVKLSEFGASEDETGKPTFSERPTSSHTAFDWFKFPIPAIVIPSHARREIPIEIEVPENAESGGYYQAIILSEEDPILREKGPTVGVTQEIGTLVLIKVPGLIREAGTLKEVFPERFIFWSQPIKIFTRFENTGNIHIKPTGLIEIYNMFGQKEEVAQINSTFNNVLPGTVRKFENNWSPAKLLFVLPAIGRYKVVSLVSYGLPSVTSKAEPFYFWLIPIRFILVVLGVIVIISLILYTLLKLYKRHVISQYHRR